VVAGWDNFSVSPFFPEFSIIVLVRNGNFISRFMVFVPSILSENKA